LVDRIRLYRVRRGFYNQHTLRSQPRQHFPAALDDFRRGGCVEHLLYIPRLAPGKLVQLGMSENHEQHEMAAGEIDGGIDNLGTARAVGQFRNPQNQPAAALR
jgi:hypothetical protein